MSTNLNNKKNRLYHLDLIRFFAALYVVFYHYGYRGFAKDNLSNVQYNILEDFSKYGYLGVNLFFIISGFVILMTAKNSNIIDFCISRLSRLYPAYWVGVLLSSIIIFLFGGEVFKVTFSQFIFNLTMLNGFFGVEYVDGVYWSLLVELKFYILIGIILLFNKIKHIKKISLLLLGISLLFCFFPFSKVPEVLKIIYFFTFPRWSPYFVAGMFFYLIKLDRKVYTYLPPIFISYFISLWLCFKDIDHRIVIYNTTFSKITVGVLITLFFALMLIISIGKLQILNKKIFLKFGILTYPLYLIHQNIGFIMINNFNSFINKWVLLILIITFMLLLSFIINKYIEKPLGIYIRNKLKENIFLINIKTKILKS